MQDGDRDGMVGLLEIGAEKHVYLWHMNDNRKRLRNERLVVVGLVELRYIHLLESFYISSFACNHVNVLSALQTCFFPIS